MEQTLTIGMAHHNDYHGVYFTIQDIRKELIFNKRQDLLKKINFLVIENDPGSKHAQQLKGLAPNIPNLKIIDYTEKTGTSAARNKIIEEATTTFVLVMDCHVMLCPVVNTLDRLFTFIEYNPKTNDLFSGPLVYDTMGHFSTHFNDTWGGSMWGQWGTSWQCVCENFNFAIQNENDKVSFVCLESQQKIHKCVYCDREFPKDIQFYGNEKHLLAHGYSIIGTQDHEAPVEIFAQGLGLFLTRKNAWLKFNEHCVGFGGEECYIHTKYRQNGRKCYNLPFLKWLHRFGRPDGVSYILTLENKIRNYILEFLELGLDLSPVKQHLVTENAFDENKYNEIYFECKKIYDQNKDIDPKIINEIELLKTRLLELTQKAGNVT